MQMQQITFNHRDTKTQRRDLFLKFSLCLCVSVVICSSLRAEDVAPEAGEVKLIAADADKALAELGAAFKASPAVKGNIVTEVDDLLGKRVEEGELLLDRPGRLLRKFTKPALKIWLLDGAQLQEFAAKQKTLYVKDFAKAPKALGLIQAAVTVDTKALNNLFDIHVFRGASKDGQAPLRVVLTKKAASDNPLLYKRITARIKPGELFFSQIEYVPESGDTTVEKYLNLAAAKPTDADFKLDLPADVIRKVENISDTDKK